MSGSFRGASMSAMGRFLPDSICLIKSRFTQLIRHHGNKSSVFVLHHYGCYR